MGVISNYIPVAAPEIRAFSYQTMPNILLLFLFSILSGPAYSAVVTQSSLVPFQTIITKQPVQSAQRPLTNNQTPTPLQHQSLYNTPMNVPSPPIADLSSLQELLLSSPNVEQNKVAGAGNKIDGKSNSAYGNLNQIIGLLNIAQGNQNQINGEENSVWGYGNKIVGLMNTVIGDNNRNMGEKNQMMGNSNYVIGSGNLGLGNANNLIGENNYAWGANNMIQGTKSIVAGAYNNLFGDSSIIKGTMNNNAGNQNIIFGKGNEVIGTQNQIGTGQAVGPTSEDFMYPNSNRGFTLQLARPRYVKVPAISASLPQISYSLPDVSISMPKPQINLAFNTGQPNIFIDPAGNYQYQDASLGSSKNSPYSSQSQKYSTVPGADTNNGGLQNQNQCIILPGDSKNSIVQLPFQKSQTQAVTLSNGGGNQDSPQSISQGIAAQQCESSALGLGNNYVIQPPISANSKSYMSNGISYMLNSILPPNPYKTTFNGGSSY